MVKIRLKKFGKKRQASYRIVIMDARNNRDGRAIDEVGFYHPLNKDEKDQIRVNLQKVDYWVSKGAQKTDTVSKIVNKFKRNSTTITNSTS